MIVVSLVVNISAVVCLENVSLKCHVMCLAGCWILLTQLICDVFNCLFTVREFVEYLSAFVS